MACKKKATRKKKSPAVAADDTSNGFFLGATFGDWLAKGLHAHQRKVSHLSVKAARILMSRNFSREEICEIFKVPPQMIDLTDSDTFRKKGRGQ